MPPPQAPCPISGRGPPRTPAGFTDFLKFFSIHFLGWFSAGFTDFFEILFRLPIAFSAVGSLNFSAVGSPNFSAVGSLNFFRSWQPQFFRSWQPQFLGCQLRLGLPTASWAAKCVLGYGRRKHGLPSEAIQTQPGSRKPTYEAATKSRPSPGHNMPDSATPAEAVSYALSDYTAGSASGNSPRPSLVRHAMSVTPPP